MRWTVLETLRSDYLLNLRSDVFDRNRERINDENRTSVSILLVFMFLIIAVNLVVGLFTGSYVGNELIELAVYLVLAGIAVVLLERGTVNYTVLVYLLELPLLLIALVSGTVFQPDSITFSFLLFLLVLPSIILDKPRRVVGFIWLFGLLFLVLDFLVKPAGIFSRDMRHLLNTCLISSAECLCLLSARIKNINFAADYKRQMLKDPLTGLYNRAGAELYADTSKPGALLFIDLDNFKEVNDTFGHHEGDHVLRAVADSLRHNFRRSDVIVRMGGDEFVVFAPGTWNSVDLGERLQQTLDQLGRITVTHDGRSVAITVSIGCVADVHGWGSFDEMVGLADEEMYRVKTHGKANYSVEFLG